ncbi:MULTISPECIES: hypothetical protein [Bradyrhizobium]|jgi:hypothetical protein|uniref:hypothetical protein n=1 Tax=Bradyrhizobium TaxID=374 RepID=UPI0003A70FFE|nr:hypothetical protein [Bradyrhizobium denitrificans]MCL8489361.1 hypothetical protein [Bradyrhizobium denitrificans]
MEIISRKEAKGRGLARYFTGEACKHGHVAERLASSRACVECKRANQAKRRADPKRREAIKAKDRASQAKRYADPKRREAIKAQSRANSAKYRADPAKREAMNARDRASLAKRRADPVKRETIDARVRASLAKRRADPVKREAINTQARASQAKRYADPKRREAIKAQVRASEAKRRATIAEAPPMTPEDEAHLKAISFTCTAMNRAANKYGVYYHVEHGVPVARSAELGVNPNRKGLLRIVPSTINLSRGAKWESVDDFVLSASNGPIPLTPAEKRECLDVLSALEALYDLDNKPLPRVLARHRELVLQS